MALEIYPNVTTTGRLEFAGDGEPGSASEEAAAVLGGIATDIKAGANVDTNARDEGEITLGLARVRVGLCERRARPLERRS